MNPKRQPKPLVEPINTVPNNTKRPPRPLKEYEGEPAVKLTTRTKRT